MNLFRGYSILCPYARTLGSNAAIGKKVIQQRLQLRRKASRYIFEEKKVLRKEKKLCRAKPILIYGTSSMSI
jgi:hypothetical protein